jgi:excisionase family DNA binding protein
MSISSTSSAHEPGVPGKRAYSMPEAARASSLSRSALYLAIARGELRAVKQGKRTLILDTDLCAFLSRLPAFGNPA